MFKINKVLLEHSNAYVFTYCLWLISCCKEELSSFGICKDDDSIWCLTKKKNFADLWFMPFESNISLVTPTSLN